MHTTDDLDRQLVDLSKDRKQLLRVGTKRQWQEREEMRVANTATALRARVLTESAKTNGKHHPPEVVPPTLFDGY